MAAPSSPQPQAVGETSSKINYASLFHVNSSSQSVTKTILNPIELVHGEPTIKFTMDEVAEFAREEGLHQAIVIKFSYGHPELNDIRSLLPKQLGVKGNCLVGWLAHRHFLIRFDQFEDFVVALSTQVRYLKFKSEEILYRVFPWSQWFNPKEETSIALTWISLPSLPPSMFARKALLSIASAVGKPLAIDKATQIKSRPSTARVKVLVDLLDKHPKRIKLCYLDEKTGKVLEQYQEVVYDSLPLYCMVCKHQGHDVNSCWHNSKSDAQKGLVQPSLEANNVEQLKGDARAFLNAKRAGNQMAELSSTKKLASTNLNAGKVMENVTFEAHNNATNLIDESNVELGQQLPQNRGVTSDKSNIATPVALKSMARTLPMGKEATIADSGQNIIATGEGEVTENLEMCKANFVAEKCSNEEGNKAENWTLVAHKNAAGSHIRSSTSRGNSPSHEKGEIENLKLPTQNVFAPLAITRERQLEHSSKAKIWTEQVEDEEYQNNGREINAAEEHNDQSEIKEVADNEGEWELPNPKETIDTSDTETQKEAFRNKEDNMNMNANAQIKLNPLALEFVPEGVSAKKNEPETLVSEFSPTKVYDIDMDNDSFEDDEELDAYFDEVARDGDISPRYQRSGSHKSKKKTHGRQCSWDGKVIGEFVPRHLPMRLAKKNHMTVSIDSTRFNKFKK